MRQSVYLPSQPPPRNLCVDDESLDSLGWCALVPPLFLVPRIRVVDHIGSLSTDTKSLSKGTDIFLEQKKKRFTLKILDFAFSWPVERRELEPFPVVESPMSEERMAHATLQSAVISRLPPLSLAGYRRCH